MKDVERLVQSKMTREHNLVIKVKERIEMGQVWMVELCVAFQRNSNKFDCGTEK